MLIFVRNPKSLWKLKGACMTERVKRQSLVCFLAVVCILPAAAFVESIPSPLPASFPNGRVGQPYFGPTLSTQPSGASNAPCPNTGFYAYTITSGSLPSGLIWNTPNNVTTLIQGTPRQAGTFPLTLQMSCNGTVVLAQQNYSIIISPATLSP